MQFRRQKSHINLNPDLTPLIDTVFLLLIFFMVSTSFAAIRYGIKVNLPTATTAREKVEENIIISITRDNNIYFGKKWVKEENLVNLLRKRLTTYKKDIVIINADEETRHGRVVEVMDLVRQAGITKLGILTTQEEK